MYIFNLKRVLQLFLQLASETFLVLSIRRDIITNVNKPSCKVTVILVGFLSNIILPTDFRKIVIYQISWRSIQWEPSCSMRTDGRTDRQQTWRS